MAITLLSDDQNYVGNGNHQTKINEIASAVNTAVGTASLTIGSNKISWVTGSPEGAVTGIVGDLALRLDGGASTTLYVKTSGTGNTGWTAK